MDDVDNIVMFSRMRQVNSLTYEEQYEYATLTLIHMNCDDLWSFARMEELRCKHRSIQRASWLRDALNT